MKGTGAYVNEPVRYRIPGAGPAVGAPQCQPCLSHLTRHILRCDLPKLKLHSIKLHSQRNNIWLETCQHKYCETVTDITFCLACGELLYDTIEPSSYLARTCMTCIRQSQFQSIIRCTTYTFSRQWHRLYQLHCQTRQLAATTELLCGIVHMSY